MVNQLIDIDFDGNDQLNVVVVDDYIGSMHNNNNKEMKNRIKKAVKLCLARQEIQTKYLNQLKSSNEAKCLSIVKVPLLSTEVTGVLELMKFSKLLTGNYTNDDDDDSNDVSGILNDEL